MQCDDLVIDDDFLCHEIGTDGGTILLGVSLVDVSILSMALMRRWQWWEFEFVLVDQGGFSDTSGG